MQVLDGYGCQGYRGRPSPQSTHWDPKAPHYRWHVRYVIRVANAPTGGPTYGTPKPLHYRGDIRSLWRGSLLARDPCTGGKGWFQTAGPARTVMLEAPPPPPACMPPPLPFALQHCCRTAANPQQERLCGFLAPLAFPTHAPPPPPEHHTPPLQAGGSYTQEE